MSPYFIACVIMFILTYFYILTLVLPDRKTSDMEKEIFTTCVGIGVTAIIIIIIIITFGHK